MPLIETDGTTVWVHNDSGFTIARFGRMGIDVHNDQADGCLHCTHERTDSYEAWCEFVAAVHRYHGILIEAEYQPQRCAL
jgi:hypothetical protein